MPDQKDNEKRKLKSALSRIPAEKIPDEYLAREFEDLQTDPSVAAFFDVALRVYGINYGIILRIAASPAGSALLSAAFTAAGVPIPPNVLASIASAGLDAQGAYQAAKYGEPAQAATGSDTAAQVSNASVSRGGERRDTGAAAPTTDDSRKKLALAALTVLGIAAALY